MPSCHSVHDLELAVQDLWAHLPQDKAIHECTSFRREFSTSKNQMLDILDCVTGARTLVS
ncbi:hypothetical protein TNCV_752961, partial [Trichonephila clavipes]